MLDKDACDDLLNDLDRMIGKQYNRLQVFQAEDGSALRLVAHCSVCKRQESSEQETAKPGWGKRLIDDLLWNCDQHFKTHSRSALVIPRNYDPLRHH
ncbi:MAG: hypothetical protein KGL39_18930 [Patescibacteria group bacterium]|nr:hypothetical protein [Patescibacteria group bacterium]